MNNFICVLLSSILALSCINCSSLNNASLRPRGERAESSGIDAAPTTKNNNSNYNKTISEQQLEFDFVHLPGYGVLDEKNSTSQGNFSCYERRYGYYADVNKQCSMFHLCYPVKEPNSGEIIYQRFSFACSDNSIFDQQHLLCLDEVSLTTKCEKSPEYFDISNQRLVASLQQSVPGLFALSEDGVVINATLTNSTKPLELEEAGSEHEEVEEFKVWQPAVYGYNDPAFI